MTGKQRKYLRALAHDRKAVVQIGQRGLSDSVLRQIDAALTDHELIKVRVSSESPIDRREAAGRLCDDLGCETAGAIGRVLILYRADAANPRIRVPGGPDETSEQRSEECPTTSD